ncbi:hypothetical protein D9M68_773970 [compost metagenome]
MPHAFWASEEGGQTWKTSFDVLLIAIFLAVTAPPQPSEALRPEDVPNPPQHAPKKGGGKLGISYVGKPANWDQRVHLECTFLHLNGHEEEHPRCIKVNTS